MNSSDGSNPPGSPPQSPPSRPRLELDGDASHVRNADRVSTVVVHAEPDDEPTPPPGSYQFPPSRPTPAPVSNRFPSQALSPISSPEEVLEADEPTPLPGSYPAQPTHPGGAYQQAPPRPHPQTGGYQQVHSPHPQSGAFPAAGQPHHSGGYQQARPQHPQTGAYPPAGPPATGAFNAEHLTNTGFNPTGHFQAVTGANNAIKAAKKKPAVNVKDLKNVKFTWRDNADVMERLQYAGGGFLAGAFFGCVLGVLNAALQGWDVADGVGQIFVLAAVIGAICAATSAMRPRRVDELLSRFSFFQDSDQK